MQDTWVFDNDPAGFIDWINAHPEGYLVNLRTEGLPAGTVSPMLHRADCGHFKGEDHLNWTDNVKVCAETQFMLSRWCGTELGIDRVTPCDCLR
jgi:hypothetical protein